jgi:septin family protein
VGKTRWVGVIAGMLAGLSLTSSFINLLSDSLKEHIHGNSQSHETPSSPTAPGPPVSPGTTPRSTSARTTRLSSTTLLVDASEWVQLRLIDTPGLELGSEAVQVKERERGIAGVLRLVEERFEERLREESRIVRRQVKGAEDLVHLSGSAWRRR